MPVHLLLALCVQALAGGYAGESLPRGLQEAEPQLSPDQRWTGHASYTIGVKVLNGGWAPASDQAEVGIVDVDFKPPGWPISLAAQFLFSYTGQVPDTVEKEALLRNQDSRSSGTYELNLGIRKVWAVGEGVELFAGGGASLIGAAAQTYFNSGDVKDYEGGVGAGAWVSAGSYIDLGEGWHLGMELEYSWGEVQLFQHSFNAGGFHALLLIGSHW